MARGRKTNPGSDDTGKGGQGDSKAGLPSFTFINVHFNEQDQRYLGDNWTDAPSHTFEWLADLPIGYKLSITLDKVSGRYNATLACSVVDDQNCNLILSARGATAAASLWALVYADSIKFDGQWRQGTESNKSLFG